MEGLRHMFPSGTDLKRKLIRVHKALDNPENKWEERDKEYLKGFSDALEWVLGQKKEEPKSPEADV